MRFHKRKAIITGGARGIGAAIAGRLAEEGVAVAIWDQDGEAAETLAAQLQGGGAQASAFSVNVTDKAAVTQAVADTRKALGGLDILVNNAGVLRDQLIYKRGRDGAERFMSEEDWDFVLDVNLKGPFLCIQACVPSLIEQRYGRIVNIASRAYLGNRGQANYSASKGGLVSLTRALALELGAHQITVNAVAPGLIDTPLTRGLKPEVYEMLVQAQPTKRAGTPEDVGAAVAFLSSDDAGFITGHTLMVDGGKSTGLAQA